MGIILFLTGMLAPRAIGGIAENSTSKDAVTGFKNGKNTASRIPDTIRQINSAEVMTNGSENTSPAGEIIPGLKVNHGAEPEVKSTIPTALPANRTTKANNIRTCGHFALIDRIIVCVDGLSMNYLYTVEL